jgi:hypothetical protein
MWGNRLARLGSKRARQPKGRMQRNKVAAGGGNLALTCANFSLCYAPGTRCLSPHFAPTKDNYGVLLHGPRGRPELTLTLSTPRALLLPTAYNISRGSLRHGSSG